MNDTKPWYTSTAVWASLVQILVGLAASFGIIDATAGATIVEQTPGLIVALVTTVAGFLTLYGRVAATKQVTLAAEPKK